MTFLAVARTRSGTGRDSVDRTGQRPRVCNLLSCCPPPRTSQSTESGSLEAATLSSVLDKLWDRLYVHRMAVIFIFF